MKTPEEIKQSVLNECGRLCPTKMGRFLIGDGMYIKHGMNGWVISAVDGIGLFDLLIFNENSAPAILLSAYRLLNIEAKEIEERAKGLVAFAKECFIIYNEKVLGGSKAFSALKDWMGNDEFGKWYETVKESINRQKGTKHV